MLERRTKLSDDTGLSHEERELLAELRSQVDAFGRGQAVAEYAPDGTVMRANERFAELMGYSTVEIIGRNHSSFVPSEVVETSEYAELWEELRSGGNLTGEFRRVWQGKRACGSVPPSCR